VRLVPPGSSSLASRRASPIAKKGPAVCDGVRGRLRAELRLTWLGGMRILERVERNRLNLFDRRPVLGAADLPLILWRAAVWKRARR